MTTDDRDDAGPLLPVPRAQAELELREETRTETWILARSLVLLVLIGTVLTLRAVYL